MPGYTTNNRMAGAQQAMGSSFKTALSLTAATATLKRGKLTDLTVGADGAPNATDCQIVWDVSRQTAAGTSTAATPTPLDPADTAAGTVGAVNYTAEGTITGGSSLLMMALNQRASQRWAAVPGSELVWPATNLAGLAVRALSPTYTGNFLAHAWHIE